MQRPCTPTTEAIPTLKLFPRPFESAIEGSPAALAARSARPNALAWLALYGFLDKLRRIVRATGLLGPRVRQTSNAYVLSFPKGLGGLAVNVFGLAPDHNNWAPSESNSEVKKGFQGSGSDLGLNFGVATA